MYGKSLLQLVKQQTCAYVSFLSGVLLQVQAAASGTRAVPWGACLMKSLVSYTAYRLSPVAQALHGTLAEWDLHAF